MPLEQHLHAGLETNSQIQKPDTNSGILGHAFFLNDEDYSTEKLRIPGLDTDEPRLRLRYHVLLAMLHRPFK